MKKNIEECSNLLCVYKSYQIIKQTLYKLITGSSISKAECYSMDCFQEHLQKYSWGRFH